LPLERLRSGVSTASVSGNLSKLGQTPLVTISVQAKGKRKPVQDAANDLAQIVVTRLSKYATTKIAILKAQIASDTKQIAAIDKSLNSIAASDAAMAALSEQRSGTLSDEAQTDQLLLVQAKTVEQGSVLTKATATKTTGRNRRSSLVVGAALGLLIGALVALMRSGSRRSRAS
jgi:DNA-binding transcriptional regulator GbsR (MarR family)